MAQIPAILSFYVVHPLMSQMYALGTWTGENDRGEIIHNDKIMPKAL